MDKGSEVNDFLGVQSLSDISEEFTTAEDALAAYTAAELALDLGYESFSNWAKIELSGTCSLTLIDVEHTDDITAWANERIKEKCASFDQAMLDEINSSFSDIVEKHPRNMAQRELDLLTDTNPEQARDIIFDAFSRASTPYELGVAVNAFMNRENEPVVASLMADDRLRVGYAVEMLTRCKVFSGCDADSFLVLSNCLNMGQCLEGWNMLDFLENNFTPIQMEYARQIAAMLMAQRFAQR